MMGPYIIRVRRPKRILKNREECWGMFRTTSSGRHFIDIRANMAPTHAWETFLHELVEAANSIYELNLPHPKIATLSVCITQALLT